ncbi:hypothetical protein BC835DRAFT_901486 [Cytidiella melzeri]|nr:hypothetical protein BC835DRAFT_901486 [Cytidiella melzeri]
MPDWNSPTELAVDAAAFTKLMHALAGVYFWEFLTSLDFDWSFISGKRKFGWPMIFYFLDRYFLFFAMIGILIALDSTSEINCQALYTFDQLAGDAAVGLASINLAIRTMALWSQKLFIVIPIVVIIIGHWVLILQGILLKAEWIPGQGCAITQTKTTILAATFIYSMCFDLLILVLTSVKLRRPGEKRSQLMTMLFKDGLIYFFIAFISNLVATIFMVLNLNAVMSVIFNVPAAIASTIVACRAVRRLQNWSSKGPEVFSSGPHSQIAFHSNAGGQVSSRLPQAVTIPHNRKASGGVHVQMETFAVSEVDQESDHTTYKRQSTDIENAEISSEFKRPPY